MLLLANKFFKHKTVVMAYLPNNAQNLSILSYEELKRKIFNLSYINVTSDRKDATEYGIANKI